MAATNLQKIVGNWAAGYALDIHTTGSTFLGTDQFGHDRFDTTRSELGELLYRLKTKGDQTVVAEIVTAAAKVLQPHRAKFDMIVPVPPSRTRTLQPVIVMAEALGAALELPVAADCIRATRPTSELKDVSDPEKRKELLQGLFTVDPAITAQKRILLFDDLFRSGATMNAITDVLVKQGKAARVQALTITRTRSNR